MKTLDENFMNAASAKVLDTLDIRFANFGEKIEKLSGGQRQAVAIARAMYWQARLMIMDEPTNNLGVVEQRKVLDLITRLREERVPVILISHTLPDVFAVTNRIVVMHQGARSPRNAPARLIARKLSSMVGALDDTQGAPELLTAKATGAALHPVDNLPRAWRDPDGKAERDYSESCVWGPESKPLKFEWQLACLKVFSWRRNGQRFDFNLVCLRNPVFCRLWVAGMLSGTFVSAQDVIATWLMHDLGASAFALSSARQPPLPSFSSRCRLAPSPDIVNRRSGYRFCCAVAGGLLALLAVAAWTLCSQYHLFLRVSLRLVLDLPLARRSGERSFRISSARRSYLQRSLWEECS